jgi:hypothetical protein
MKMDNDRDAMTDSTRKVNSTLESIRESIKAFRYTVPNESLKVQSAAPITSVSVLISVSLLVTLVMIGLSVALKHYESDMNAAGIITSFVAGMFGYATFEFLRRGFQKI